MDVYGFEERDSANRITLSMDDFTLFKLASMQVPAANRTGQGIRSDFILFDVPGYDPNNCFVLITPSQYASYEQPGYSDGWGMVPTYRELGGTQIAIFTYVNIKYPTGVGNDYRDQWVENTCPSTIEAVRFR